MSKQVVHILFVFFLLALATVFGIWFLGSISPEDATIEQFGILYFLIFLGIFSSATIFGYVFRKIFWRSSNYSELLRSSERQAVLLGFLGVTALILQSASILNFPIAILLLLIFTLIEFYAR